MSCETWTVRVLLVGVLFAVSGCQLTPAPGLVACPLPVHEQAAELVRVVPLGTSRDDVLKKLKEAGIYGSFGENQSIFYCDAWQRDKTQRWHINVALLFDENGKLYATRPSATGTEESAASAGEQPGSAEEHDPFK